jgi:hypothetical protein
MTLSSFEMVVASAEGLGESDQVWFPKWLPLPGPKRADPPRRRVM